MFAWPVGFAGNVGEFRHAAKINGLERNGDARMPTKNLSYVAEKVTRVASRDDNRADAWNDSHGCDGNKSSRW